jgi:hypothetical protein
VKRFVPLVVAYAWVLALPAPATAHPGGVDANGCHYARSTGKAWQDTYHCHEQKPPAGDAAATVKKSRENICHDVASPNYTTLRYFVAYQSMKQCTGSGGRAYQH